MGFTLGSSGDAGGYGRLTDLDGLADTAATRYSNAYALGRVLDTDAAKNAGAGATGFLTGALGMLGRPSSAAIAYIKGSNSDEKVGGAWDALAHGKKFSFGDSGPLHSEADDNIAVRAAKGTGAFVADTLADPLNFLTFGTAGLGRKVGSQVLANTVENAGKLHLGEDALDAIGRTSAQFRKGDAAGAAMRDDVFAKQGLDTVAAEKNLADEALATHADAAALHASQAPNAAMFRTPEDLAAAEARFADESAIINAKGVELTHAQQAAAAKHAGIEAAGQQAYEDAVKNALGSTTISQAGARHLGDLAGEAFLRGGPAEVRRVLASDDAFGAELGEKIWKSLPSNLRGGLQFRANPLGDTAHSITGGGTLPAVDKAKASALNFLRTNTSGVSHLFGGPDAKDYTGVLRTIAGKGDAAGKDAVEAFGNFRATKELRAFGDNIAAGLAANHGAVAGAAAHALDTAARNGLTPEEARATLNGLAMDRDAAKAALADETTDATTRALAKVAADMHAGYDNLHRQAVEAGVEIGELEDYIPRMMTDEYADLRAANAAPISAGGAGAAAPTKHRRAFSRQELDENGNLKTVFDPIAHVNELMAEKFGASAGKVFEDDALKMFDGYSRVMRRIIANKRLENKMVDLGMAARVGADQKLGAFDGGRLGALANATRASLAGDRDLLKKNGIDATEEHLADDEKLHQLIASMAGKSSHDLANEAGDVLEALAGIEARRARTLGEAGLDGRAAGATRTAGDLASTRVKDFFHTDPIGDAAARKYWDSGYRYAGTDDSGQHAARGWVGGEKAANLMVTDNVREMARRYWQMEEPGKAEEFLTNYYTPLYTLLKTVMTIGRGPGYHVRNVLGGAQNAWFLGANARDFADSGKVIATVQAATNTGAKKGLTGSALTDFVADAIRTSHGDAKLGNTTLADAYKMAADQGIFTHHHVSDDIVANADTDAAATAVRKQAKDSKAAAFLAPRRSTAARMSEDAPKPAKAVAKGVDAVLNVAPMRASARMGEVTEQYVRFASFLSGMRKYDDPRSAALLVKASQFSYDPRDLSKFERTVVKQMVPFWTWTKNNTPLIARVLKDNPGKINAIVTAHEDIAGGVLGDPDAKAEFEAHEPDWLRRAGGLVTRYSPSGDPLTLKMESPVNDLNNLFNWTANPAELVNGRQVVASLNPILKTGLESATGVNSDTGAEFNPEGSRAAAWQRFVPGLTHEDENGVLRSNDFGNRAMHNLLPPLGQVENMVPAVGAEEAQSRRYSNWGSFLGAPLSTRTTQQTLGEDLARADRMNAENKDVAQELGVTTEQLMALINKGYTAEQIMAAVPALAERNAAQRAAREEHKDETLAKHEAQRAAVAAKYGF